MFKITYFQRSFEMPKYMTTSIKLFYKMMNEGQINVPKRSNNIVIEDRYDANSETFIKMTFVGFDPTTQIGQSNLRTPK